MTDQPIGLEAIKREHANEDRRYPGIIGWASPDAHDHRGQLIAEVERLRAENSRLILSDAAIDEIRKVCKEIMGDNLAFVDDDFARCLLMLRARVAELERDAARYRWLRDDESSFAVMLPREHGHIAFGGEALDSKIDAAMSEGEAVDAPRFHLDTEGAIDFQPVADAAMSEVER